MTPQKNTAADDGALAPLALGTGCEQTSSPEWREAAARLVWFMFGDNLSAADAMSERNDAHWQHWRGHEDARSAYDCVDAIASLPAPGTPGQAGGEG